MCLLMISSLILSDLIRQINSWSSPSNKFSLNGPMKLNNFLVIKKDWSPKGIEKALVLIFAPAAIHQQLASLNLSKNVVNANLFIEFKSEELIFSISESKCKNHRISRVDKSTPLFKALALDEFLNKCNWSDSIFSWLINSFDSSTTRIISHPLNFSFIWFISLKSLS